MIEYDDYALEVRYRTENDPLSHRWTKEVHMEWALQDAKRCKEVLNDICLYRTHVWIYNHRTGETTHV